MKTVRENKMRIIALFLSLMIFGCSHTTTTETLADGAKETISDIYESLPKECQSDMTKVAFDSAMKQVESVKAKCSEEKSVLNEKIKQRNLLIAVLIGLLLCVVYRKVRQFLSH